MKTSSKTTRSGSSACWRLLSHRLLLHGAEIGQVPSHVFHFVFVFFSCYRDQACSVSSLTLCWAFFVLGIYISQRTQFSWRLRTISMSSCPNVTIKEHNWIGQLSVHIFCHPDQMPQSRNTIELDNWLSTLVCHPDQMLHCSKVCKWEASKHPWSLGASCWTWRVHPCFRLPCLQRRIPGQLRV